MRVTLLGSVLVLATLASGCAGFTGRPVGQFVNDVTMTIAVKDEIAGIQGWRSLRDISVETYNDTVTLTGTVPDQATWTRIDQAVRWTAGSNRVNNQLMIGAPQAEALGR